MKSYQPPPTVYTHSRVLDLTSLKSIPVALAIKIHEDHGKILHRIETYLQTPYIPQVNSDKHADLMSRLIGTNTVLDILSHELTPTRPSATAHDEIWSTYDQIHPRVLELESLSADLAIKITEELAKILDLINTYLCTPCCSLDRKNTKVS